MESVQDVINMLEPVVFLASIDLKDRFFLMPIYYSHQKCFKTFYLRLS